MTERRVISARCSLHHGDSSAGVPGSGRVPVRPAILSYRKTVNIMLSGVYGGYVAVSVIVTVWIARTLSVTGLPFLVQVFHGQAATAHAVNQLLVAGFYLTNLGLIGITLREHIRVEDLKSGIELLGLKVGRSTTVVGLMHFGNLIVFCWLRDRTVHQERRPYESGES